MIRLLTNTYTEEDKKALHDTLCEARSRFLLRYCLPHTPCQECAYRHVCYDLDRVTDHTATLKRGVTE